MDVCISRPPAEGPKQHSSPPFCAQNGLPANLTLRARKFRLAATAFSYALLAGGSCQGLKKSKRSGHSQSEDPVGNQACDHEPFRLAVPHNSPAGRKTPSLPGGRPPALRLAPISKRGRESEISRPRSLARSGLPLEIRGPHLKNLRNGLNRLAWRPWPPRAQGWNQRAGNCALMDSAGERCLGPVHGAMDGAVRIDQNPAGLRNEHECAIIN